MAASETCTRVIWLDDGGPLVSEPCAREAGHAGACRESSWSLASLWPHAARLLAAPIETLRSEGESRGALILARRCAWEPTRRGAGLVLALAEDDPRRVAYERVLERGL